WNEESFVPLPAYSSPFTTAGEDSTCFPVAKVHSGGHEGWPHPPRANASTVPSVDPVHTSPFATAGEDSTAPPTDPAHAGGHDGEPHPPAGKASTPPAWDPAKTYPP